MSPSGYRPVSPDTAERCDDGRVTDGNAAVVLAGGRSRRMGRDKADLPWAGTTMLGAVLEVLASAVDGALVVVGPADRPRALPPLPPAVAARVVLVADPVADRGPLQGLATGLRAAAGAGAPRAFVASVDLPRLHTAYVRAVLAALDGPDAPEGTEAALPVVDGHRQPLAAAYATVLGDRAATLLASGARRPGDLFAVSRVRELTAGTLLADPALAAVDPQLTAVRDVDTPADLHALTAPSPPPGDGPDNA